MKTRPVAVMAGIEELRTRVAAGHHEYAILLAGGAAHSRKTIRRSRSGWVIRNHIDATTQVLGDDGLWSESNIGIALDRLALLDMDGDEGLLPETLRRPEGAR